jgi:hypothetical protein
VYFKDQFLIVSLALEASKKDLEDISEKNVSLSDKFNLLMQSKVSIADELTECKNELARECDSRKN